MPSSLRWSGPSRSTRKSFRYRLRTHPARQRRFRPDGAARISAEHRQTGSDLPTRIHALPGLRLYRAEQQRLYRGLAGLRLLAGLWLRLSLRRVPRLRIWRRSLASLRRVPRWRIPRWRIPRWRVPRWRVPRSGGFSRRSQVRPFQPGDRTHGRLRPEITSAREIDFFGFEVAATLDRNCANR
jgi:hypothetical protein